MRIQLICCINYNAIFPITQTFSEDNRTTIMAAVIAVIGVFFGALLTFISQIVLNAINNHREKQKVVFERQLQLFPIVLEYITEYSKLYEMKRNSNSQDSIKKQKEVSNDLFAKFYYSFSVICKTQTIEDYHRLINDIEKGNINQDVALKRIKKILAPYVLSKKERKKYEQQCGSLDEN